MNNTIIQVGTEVRIVGTYPPVFGTVIEVVSESPEATYNVEIPGWGTYTYGTESLQPRPTR